LGKHAFLKQKWENEQEWFFEKFENWAERILELPSIVLPGSPWRLNNV
jgi:hypothetical protein